jgi:hypothetical protein
MNTLLLRSTLLFASALSAFAATPVAVKADDLARIAQAVPTKAPATPAKPRRLGIKPAMIGLEYSYDWFESLPKIAECIQFFNTTTLPLAR